ncbi:MAG: VOC family protein [Fibrella sp.]|nr:VOC family protein [Armatimonadota bacterium]
MKLNHLNLNVTDVIATRQFLEKYFGMRGMDEKYNPGFDALFDDNDMVLTLFRFAKGKEMEYPPTFHIGFIQESEERVNEINRQLKDDGYEVPEPARMHGSWTFYFRCPGGFTIEVLS